jgi:membrane protease YdiL (CAAX protease family)
MKNNRLSAKEWGQRILLALLFTAMAAFILLVFSPWRATPRLGFVDDYLAKIGVSVVLLVAALLSRRSERLKKYWQVLFALFILTVAISLDWVIPVYVRRYMGVNDSTPAGWALQKLNECFVVASVIVTFTLASGNNLGSLYIQKGNLKLGLTIGLASFFIFAAGAIPMASLFQAQNLSMVRIIPWIPYILIHVLSNGTMEEMLFRGLFLRKLEPLVGKFLSIFLLAFVFTGLHSWVSYTADNRIFLAVTFPLALALGYIMQKTDSVWGSILLHAGMDIPIMLGTFSNLK